MAERFKPCSVDGCKGNAHWSVKGARGYCRNHWRRNKEYGDPLAGRTPDGEAPRFYAEVVLSYDGDDCLIWPYARSYGYGILRVGGKSRAVHRLACEAVHGPPPTKRHEAAHKCGQGGAGCVNPRHVRWATPTENQKDRIAHGTSNRGSRCAASKLTEDDVIQIRRLRGKMTQAQIGERFGVNYITVGDIHNRRTWAWLK